MTLNIMSLNQIFLLDTYIHTQICFHFRTYASWSSYHLPNVAVDFTQKFLGPFPQSSSHAVQAAHRGERQERAVEEKREETATLGLI